jgi:CheY-like chemotaxis protein
VCVTFFGSQNGQALGRPPDRAGDCARPSGSCQRERGRVVPRPAAGGLTRPKVRASTTHGRTACEHNGAVTDTVLIVDDHAAFRRSARLLLEADGYKVIGEADDGRSALFEIESLAPDVVLLDVFLPDLDGFQVASELTGRGLAVVVVLTSSRDGRDFGALVSECGARGFIPKTELSGASLAALVGP